MSEDNITDFLPKYPSIQNRDFNQLIYNKKEFYDNRLSVVEQFPDSPGVLMKHQKNILRFLSSYTPYDELLLVHYMGTGKTCSAIGAIEHMKNSGKFIGAIILAKGDGILNNFMDELIFKCTDGRYIPDNFDKLTELEKTHRMNKSVSKFYHRETFETFAKELKKLPDKIIIQKYSNMIVVIDEVHNLRLKETYSDINIYEQIHRFLHLIVNSKKILMTGTPMKDTPDEIASVMNLILPLNNQMETGKSFIKRYTRESDTGAITLKSSSKSILKDFFRGRVSYLKSMKSSVIKTFSGQKIGTLEHFNVVEDFMGEIQSKQYMKALNIDKNEKKGIYNQSRQASLFVFPDGTYGSDGFKKYIKITKNKKNTVSAKVSVSYYMSGELLKFLNPNGKADTTEDKLNNIKVCSSKYESSIRSILKYRDEGKAGFAYSEFVEGSGCILFSLLLTLFGFSKANGSETTKSPRYIIMTNKTMSTKEMRRCISRFSRKDNVNGEYINLIIGSRVISEGFSFRHIQFEEILTPHWNYSETEQAISRGDRLGSHNDIELAGIQPTLTVNQRVSIPTSGITYSIDLIMYELSEKKDMPIKAVERLIMESSFDCQLNFDRNRTNDIYKNQRDCNYMSCDYKCDGISETIVPYDKQDLITYNLYYSDDLIYTIIEKIRLMYDTKFMLTYDEIKSYINQTSNTSQQSNQSNTPDVTNVLSQQSNTSQQSNQSQQSNNVYLYSDFEIIRSLSTIIDRSVLILNKYGLPCYIKEEGNIFFLVPSLSSKSNILSTYYTEHVTISEHESYKSLIDDIFNSNLSRMVNDLCDSSNIDNFKLYMTKLPDNIKEEILEYSILAEKKNITHNANLRKQFLEHFKGYYAEIDNMTISWFLYEKYDIVRYLTNDVWKDGDDSIMERVNDIKNNNIKNLEKNKYGYYGQINNETNDFCIRDIQDDIPAKKHLRTSGKRCSNWKRNELIEIAVNSLKIDPIKNEHNINLDKKSLDMIKQMSIADLVSNLTKNKYVSKDLDISSLNKKDLIRYVYWSNLKVETLCSNIKDWFDKNNLLMEDTGCGKHTKKKI
jgi:superfamily II DNA or RNA helicase